MNKFAYFFLCLLASSCSVIPQETSLVSILIEDRNGLSETISEPNRLKALEKDDFLTNKPYKKVFRVYKTEGKNFSKITTYHPNGSIFQYLEAQEMRALGVFREWFPNGQLKIEAKVIGGPADLTSLSQQSWLFDGICKVYDDAGHLIAEISYEKGEISGTSLYYYASGKIKRCCPYSQSKLHGEALDYWENGALYAKTHYQNGVKEGLSLGFWDDEGPCWIEEYQAGALHRGVYYSRDGEECSDIFDGFGFQTVFDQETVQKLVEYKQGQPEGLVRSFTPLGALHVSYHLKQGKKHGEEIEYYLPHELPSLHREPIPKLSLNWDNDLIQGLEKTWYPSGTLQSQSEWVRNQKIGSSCAWYKDGSIMLIEEYQEGQLLEGKYFRRGQKEPISTIKNGNGTATLYDAEGLFLRKVAYFKGKPADS